MRFKQHLMKEGQEEFALDVAASMHTGQKRKFADLPYISHPKRVAQIVKKYKQSHKLKELMSAAYLHDTAEDTWLNIQHIRQLFGGLVASLVSELTTDDKQKEKLGKEEYLAQKMTGMSDWALVLKLADRLDNVYDLKSAEDKFAEKTIRQTDYILNHLEKNRKLTKTQKELVDAIKSKIDAARERL